MSPHLSLREAASSIGVHHTTLSRAVKRGDLAPVARTPGGYPRFTREAVEAYAARSLGAQPPAAMVTKHRRLRETVLLLSSELRPEVVLQRLAELARRLVHARYGALAVMESDGAIREFYTVGLSRAQRTALGPLPQGRGLLGELFKEGRTVRVADIAAHPHSVGFPPNHPPMRSLLGVPITSQGRNVGNIYLTDKVGATEFSQQDQELMEELAEYAAVAIRNAGLYQQTQERSERWTALQAIANRITLAMDPQAVLRQVVLDARSLLGVDSAFISLLNPATGRLRTVTSSGVRRQRRDLPPLTVTAGAGNIAIWGRTPLVIDDYATDTRFQPAYKERIAAMGLVSLIVAPLEARGQALGALYLGTRRRRRFQPEEAELVGQLASLAAVVLDNARQYAAERSAHFRAEQAEARLQTILEHEPEAVVVVAPDRRVLSANPAAGRLFFGRDGVKLTGRRYPFGARFHKPDGTPLPAEQWPVALCLDDRGPCLGLELLLDRPKGGRTPVLVNAVRIPSSEAGDGAVVAVLQDISHLKQVEQLKNDFMAMISHDLKSPLTTIKGMASSMQLESKGESVVVPLEWPKVIEAEVDRLTDLVDNLLDMSRIESGAMPLDLEECYVADLIPDCVWRVAQGDEAVAARIKVDTPDDLPPVMADYLQLQRVLCNLLNNAIKYSGAGTAIALRARLAANGTHLAVEVQDEGMGISPQEQQMVFEKFYRSKAHQTRGGKSGSGLGLAICRAIIGAHGGTISVTSQVNSGSTFRFELPLQTND